MKKPTPRRLNTRLIVLVLLLLIQSGFSQVYVKIKPGSSITLRWDYPVLDESTITGFKAYRGPASTGPWTLVSTINPNLREVKGTAYFYPGVKITYYKLRAYKSTPTGDVYSTFTNKVKIECASSCP